MPQDDVLGLMQFTAYISPLGDIIKTFVLDYHLDADDTQHYVSFCPCAADRLNLIYHLCNCPGDKAEW